MAEFNFTPGTIIDARGQIGVIVDVLRSATTQNVVLYVRFVHNPTCFSRGSMSIGNAAVVAVAMAGAAASVKVM